MYLYVCLCREYLWEDTHTVNVFILGIETWTEGRILFVNTFLCHLENVVLTMYT